MLTKRMFLKGTVAALASVGSIASAQAKSVAPDTKWDKETDRITGTEINAMLVCVDGSVLLGTDDGVWSYDSTARGARTRAEEGKAEVQPRGKVMDNRRALQGAPS